MKPWQANMGLLGAAVIWGSSFVATDMAFETYQPLQMQVIRFTVAALVMSLIFYRRLLRMSRACFLAGLALGLCFFTAMSLQSYGLVLTTPSKNAFFTVTNVLIVPLMLFLYVKWTKRSSLQLSKQQLDDLTRDYASLKAPFCWGLALMMLGFLLICFTIDLAHLSEGLSAILQAESNFNRGDALSLACAVGFATHIMMVGRFVKDYDPFCLLIMQTWVGALLSMGMQLMLDQPLWVMDPHGFWLGFWPSVYMAIFSSFFAFGAQVICQQYTGAAQAAVLMSLESVFAVIFSVILHREPYFSGLLVGTILITLGVIWAEAGSIIMAHWRRVGMAASNATIQ